MLYNDRKMKILELFQKKPTLKVTELSQELGVSVDTVRRDLKMMEKDTLLKCIHGGAILNADTCGVHQYGSFNAREISNKDYKRQAAKKAVQEIHKEDLVFIGAGTTSCILAEEIATACSNITVVTNSIEVSHIFSEIRSEEIQLILLGGILNKPEKSLYGPQCEKEIAQYFPDICFLSINAVDTEHGFTDFRLLDVSIMQAAQKNSSRVVAVMDSSKFDCCSQKQIFKPEDVDVVYTDNTIQKDVILRYRECGFSVL